MRNFFLLLLIASACNAPDFKDFSQLGELRIMGIVADTPEIDGTRSDDVQVVLTPYLSHISGGARKFTVVVVSCLDPSLSQETNQGCLDPKFAAYPNGNTFDTQVLAEDNFTGAMDAVTITIVNPAAQLAAFSPQQRYNGVNYVVIFRLEHGATNLTAVKAIPISERKTLNRNPEIKDITLVQQAAAKTLAPLNVDVSFTDAGGEESYTEMSADGSIDRLTESYFITWFYYTGKIKPRRILLGQSSKYQPTPRKNTLVAVVRDRRGGTAVKVRQLPGS